MIRYLAILAFFFSFIYTAKGQELSNDKWSNISCFLTHESYVYTHKKKEGHFLKLSRRDSIVHERIYEMVDTANIESNPSMDRAEMAYTMDCKLTYPWKKDNRSAVNEDTCYRNIKWHFYKKGKLVMAKQRNFLRTRPRDTLVLNMPYPADRDSVDTATSFVSYISYYNKCDLRQQRYEFFRSQTKSFLCLGIDYMPGWEYRTLRVNALQLANQDDIVARQNSERSAYSYSIVPSIGVTISDDGKLSLAGIYVRQGFITDSLGINWQTGTMNPTGNKEVAYRFENYGIGLQYKYGGHENTVNAAVLAGIYSLWTYQYFANDIQQYNGRPTGLRHQNFALQVGLGVNIRPAYGYEFHLIPTFLYNINSINRGTIVRSNLINYGLTLGIDLRWIPKRFRTEND